MRWVIENELARASRPGYPGKAVSRREVDDWMVQAKKMGVRSILCLLGSQLAYYETALGEEDGLLEYYRSKGFEVFHVAVEDYQRPPLNAAELESVQEAFDRAPKPVLIHCSAGIDRTGAAVEHLLTGLDS